MRSFRFPLERVRHWRQGQLDLEIARLEQLIGELNRMEAQRAEMRRRLTEAEAVVQHAAAAGQQVDAGRLRDLDDFRHYTAREEARIVTAEAEVQHRITQQRQAVVRARREVRLLDRLRQRAWEKWDYEYQRETEQTASDLHLAQWCRR